MAREQLTKLPGALFEIGKVIGHDDDSSISLSRISELICKIIGANACTVSLLDAEGTTLLAKASHGVQKPDMTRSFSMGEGIAGWVVANGIPVLLPNAEEDPRFVPRKTGTSIGSLICVPLSVRNKIIGAVTATAEATNVFLGSDLDLIHFIAKTIALDLQNIRLQRVSVTDPLTGVYNREFLSQNLPAELERAHQWAHPLSVAMVDVDHFKSINDSYGHSIGDQVLAMVAGNLRATIRNDDMLIRYGGEEFLAVLPRADAGRAWEVGERMRACLAKQKMTSGPEKVHISVGVAQFKYHGIKRESAKELIRRADAALYEAKSRGRNRVEVAP